MLLTTGYKTQGIEDALQLAVPFLLAAIPNCQKVQGRLLEKKTGQWSHLAVDHTSYNISLLDRICPPCNSGMAILGMNNCSVIGLEVHRM